MKKPQLINSRTVFQLTLLVVPVVLLLVYLSGVGAHRSLYLNSLLSTSILSFVFCTFITTGLYRGWKLKDGLGRFSYRFSKKENSIDAGDASGIESGDIPEFGDDAVSIIIGIVLWLLVALVLSGLFILIGEVLIASIVLLGGILYWILFRALRLIFRHSMKCKGDFIRSISYGIVYTILYNFWIYGLILAVHYGRA